MSQETGIVVWRSLSKGDGCWGLQLDWAWDKEWAEPGDGSGAGPKWGGKKWRANFLRVLEKRKSNEVPLVPPFCLCSVWGHHGCGTQGPNKLFGLLNSLFSRKLLVSSWWACQSLGTVRCCRLVRAESLLPRSKCFSSIKSQGGIAHF